LIGFLIGLACGGGEIYLLTRLTLAVQKSESGKIVGYVFLKLLLLACAFVPVILFFRQDLLWCGVGISATLVLGAVIINWRSQRSGKGDKQS